MIKKLISTITGEMSIKITMNSHLTYFMMAILKNKKCFRKVQAKKGTLYFIREGNGTPLQYSCLENPMDGGAW